jgi:hypothetical protein
MKSPTTGCRADTLAESPGREVHWRLQKFNPRTKTWKDVDLSALDEDFAVSIEFGVPESGGGSGRMWIEFETQPRKPKKPPPKKKRLPKIAETQPR